MSEIKTPNRKGLSIVSKKSERLENGLDGLKGLNLQSEEDRLNTLEKEQKRQEQKQAKKDEKLKQDATINNTQTNEISPSQEKAKIKIISFLGLTKTDKNLEKFNQECEKDPTLDKTKAPKQAKYILTSDFYRVFGIEKHQEERKMWSATECLLKEFNNDNFEFTLYGTEKSILTQKPIYGALTPKEFDQKEYSKFLGDLINDLKNDFNSNKYKKIIVDITHGFRDNTILAIFAGLIQTNINKDFKINFIVAKEIIQHQEYEFISLDEYIENMVMSNVLSTFKQCLKVPDYNLHNPLYLALKGFSDALFKNQIQDIILNLQNLEKNILDIPKSSYIYPLIKDIKDTLYDLSSCKITTNKDNEIEPTKEIYYELSRLYHKHNYALNSSQFLLEAIYFNVFCEFKKELDKVDVKYDFDEYGEIKDFIYEFADKEVVKRLDQELNKKANNKKNKKKKQYKHGKLFKIFIESYEQDVVLFNKYIELTRYISDIRNKMSHCDVFSNDLKNSYFTLMEDYFKSYNMLIINKFSKSFKSGYVLYMNEINKENTNPKMFLFFSHELSKEQITDAKNSLNVIDFIKLPNELQKLFSNVPADDKSITQVAQSFQDYLKKEAKKGDYVLISGDFGLVYQLVSFCKNRDLKPVYATTKRDVIKDENGIKQSIFKHVRFREF